LRKSCQEKADILRQSEEGEKDRDKSLERTISTLGVGLAAGGIASSITSAYIEKPLPLPYLEKSLSVPPFILAFLLSVGIAFIAGFITWGFITWQITKKTETISLQEPPPTAECISEANAPHEE
jgi:hypothetical protein